MATIISSPDLGGQSKCLSCSNKSNSLYKCMSCGTQFCVFCSNDNATMCPKCNRTGTKVKGHIVDKYDGSRYNNGWGNNNSNW